MFEIIFSQECLSSILVKMLFSLALVISHKLIAFASQRISFKYTGFPVLAFLSTSFDLIAFRYRFPIILGKCGIFV